jgi:hypothetical protein
MEYDFGDNRIEDERNRECYTFRYLQTHAYSYVRYKNPW